MKVKYAVLSVFVLVFLNGCSEPIPTGTINHVDFERAINRYKDLQLIDVRTAGEYQNGYIEGASNIDYFGDDFEMQMSKLDKLKPIAVYCGVGGRSESALEVLQELGFEVIYNLEGGITVWEKNGLQVVKE